MLEVFDLGLCQFDKALKFQKDVFSQVKARKLRASVIVCRHYPVITAGRLAKENNIRLTQAELEKKGIRIYKIERGGDVTYHDPGQLTVYPILNLQDFKKDIHLFLRQLEEVIIGLLKNYNIDGARRAGLTGVWVNECKIASIGIAIKSWITFHGLSINVKKESLPGYSLIRPCGMDVEMTSLETLLDAQVDMNDVKVKLIDGFMRRFN